MSKSCAHSNPARSPDSSDLRCHSSSAATIARSAQPPTGKTPNDRANRSRCIIIVRYTAWPDSAWPSSWPITNRISSCVTRSYSPEVITVNGLPMPMVKASAIGDCIT
ncbi:Uncharacterised protein [Mycobacterium tuberculosis]|uniref:Uncharacterized protein n=1 Tax=Mycobacterium tuberculosis TaxID=1773 RepID=A0A655ISY7_MYCTX|nr:Uncharacterised protein [Mycobacterium tuberculosis]COW15177.1 Uncharacterised protein [Mycobacterium tuberculosis]